MIPLIDELSAVAGDAFAAEGLSPELGTVQVSDRPDLGQFQSNGALAAARAAKADPRTFAERVAARLRANDMFAEVAVAGPGFINLTLTDEALGKRLARLMDGEGLAIPATGTGKRAVIDFGGPNIAKPMHVGHLRSAIIGDCLQRLFRVTGWQVTSDVHLGDWGMPMGQLISELALRRPELPYFDPAYTGPYPEDSPVTMEDLEALYPAASAACKADPGRLEAARRATAELQSGRPGYRALWRHFFRVSEEGLKREFALLGVTFDEWKGEADTAPLIASVIDDLKARGIAEPSEGALIVRVADDADQKEIPPLILLKADGAVLYGTTDLATVLMRVKEHDPDLILYVVDQRQHNHFEQVFRAARRAGVNGRAALEHVGFGTVNGLDGKPFKTRAGGVMKLYDLVAMATEEAAKRLDEQGLGAGYPPGEREEIARQVGLAAIKFADLSNHRLSSYVFDLSRFTRFEGKTGPYLQYATVRIRSILRKAEEGQLRATAPVIASREERELALLLLALPQAFRDAESKRAPNFLCDCAFTIAQSFSRFYTAHHILSETDEGLRTARLGLCRVTLTALNGLLDTLGIPVPERM